MTKLAPPATLDDVARSAGVSTATVSRCINDPDVVSGPTRARVQAAIETLGYTPNFAARSMAVRRTFTIGAIIPTMENAIFARGVQAFQEELNKNGYTLLVSSSAYKRDAEEEQIRTLVSRGADGLLLIGHDRDPKVYDFLERRRIPTLVAWSYDKGARVPSVGFDNRLAMRALTEQVLDLGHRSFGMISGESAENDRARLRILGLKDALAARGIDPDALKIIEAPYGFSEGAAAFTEMMQSPVRPSVVFCGNDVLAVGALRGAKTLGLKVPDDVSITGFDDIELAEVVTPELTTVHVPHRKMGRLAARELIEMIEDKRPGVSCELDAIVVNRDSVRGV